MGGRSGIGLLLVWVEFFVGDWVSIYSIDILMLLGSDLLLIL
jgi:hypothetical protein